MHYKSVYDDIEQYFTDTLHLMEYSDLYELMVKVPIVRAGIEARVKGVSSVPYTLYDKAGKRVKDINLTPLLKYAERSYCVYGVGYWELVRNWFGHVVDVRTMPTPQVTPYYAEGGLSHYLYTPSNGSGQSVVHLEPEDVLAFCEQPLDSEDYWEYSLLYSCSSSAQVLKGMQMFSAEYFRRGAIRNTLLQVDTMVSEKEADKLKQWWQGMVSGIKSAFNTEVIRTTVNPMTVGDGLTELNTSDIVQPYREDVLAALGVPYTQIFSNSANYATANMEKLTFYDNTIVPQLRWYERIINEKLQPYYTVQFHPERLEAYQQREVEKAQHLSALVRSGLMSTEEARSMLYEEDES